MRLAITSALQNAVLIGGVLTLVMAGVRLKIDRGLDEFFIEVDPDHSPEALKAVSRLADSLGFEAMPRWECPPQEMSSGALRHWLVDKEVVHDSSSVQAV